MQQSTLILIILATLTACSGKPTDPPAPPPATPTVIDPQLKALQDAKDLQKSMEDTEQARRKAIDGNDG